MVEANMNFWHSRSGTQKVQLVVTVITLVIITMCFATNFACSIKAAAGHWFMLCSDCHKDADRNCEACCDLCSGKDGAFYHVTRIFTMLLCALAVAAEFDEFDKFREQCKAARSYFVRGGFQVFVAFLTMTGNSAPGNNKWDGRASAASFAVTIGFFLLIVGIVHIALGFVFSPKAREAETEGKYQAAQTGTI